jgi:hypothetical protein
MNRFQQGSLFKVKRWYDYSSGKRTYKKQIIGGTGKIRSRREAERAVVALRGSINVDVGTPQTICDLDAHYEARELTAGKSRFRQQFSSLTGDQPEIARCRYQGRTRVDATFQLPHNA